MNDYTQMPPRHPVKVPKLIRDKVPELHARDGCHSVTRIVVDDAEFDLWLRRKLVEEAEEFLESGAIVELADVLEVVLMTCEARRTSLPAVAAIAREKREQIGGFRRRLLLTEFAWPGEGP